MLSAPYLRLLAVPAPWYTLPTAFYSSRIFLDETLLRSSRGLPLRSASEPPPSCTSITLPPSWSGSLPLYTDSMSSVTLSTSFQRSKHATTSMMRRKCKRRKKGQASMGDGAVQKRTVLSRHHGIHANGRYTNGNQCNHITRAKYTFFYKF